MLKEGKNYDAEGLLQQQGICSRSVWRNAYGAASALPCCWMKKSFSSVQYCSAAEIPGGNKTHFLFLELLIR